MNKMRFFFTFLFAFIFLNVNSQVKYIHGGGTLEDWANLSKYKSENLKIINDPIDNLVIFMGNSITENWTYFRPNFFKENSFLNRGISGQTTPQMLINSISLSEALNKLKISEAKNSKSRIITTAIELKSFDIIKTIIAMSSKIKNSELDRIGFKDYKGFFNIIVDNSPRKSICHMILKDNRKAISIDGKEFEIESVSAKHIIKHKSALESSTLKTLKS